MQVRAMTRIFRRDVLPLSPVFTELRSRRLQRQVATATRANRIVIHLGRLAPKIRPNGKVQIAVLCYVILLQTGGFWINWKLQLQFHVKWGWCWTDTNKTKSVLHNKFRCRFQYRIYRNKFINFVMKYPYTQSDRQIVMKPLLCFHFTHFVKEIQNRNFWWTRSKRRETERTFLKKMCTPVWSRFFSSCVNRQREVWQE